MIVKGKSQAAVKVLQSLVESLPSDFQFFENLSIGVAEGDFNELCTIVKTIDFEFPSLKEVCLAQWMLESGRGTSELFKKYYNAGGLKWREEMSGYAKPVIYEAHDGKDTYCQFLDFQSFITGYWKFIERSPYAGWRNKIATPEEYIIFLEQCRYSEDKNYAKKIIELIPEAKRLLQNIPKKNNQGTRYILLDPGHSKSKAGAVSKDKTVKEYDLNFLQAIKIKEIIETTGKFKADIIDPDDDNLEKIGMSAKGYHMSLHLHHNSYEGDSDMGTETFYDDDKFQQESKILAKILAEEISISLGTKNRGAKPFRGIVLDIAEQQGDFPAILIESYFINPYNKSIAEERSRKAAEAIAKTIIDWFD